MTARLHRKPPAWIKPGVRVDYHSIIGEPATLFGLTVATEPTRLGGKGGTWVVWLHERPGCVATEAISKATRREYNTLTPKEQP